ncbi:nod factor export ATP-binding protein [Maritalea myrionectae]|uniref:Nod factor export ATP-binding protein n=1 Tax=Maritalea myrionectae TaxID=454601 RepID=A0A2R4MFV7_9HYPH|nr:ABC transporter ATP-binding protein [Maritalea myrionectae]AVX04927.1 nod factor export ATP-binding protein [Maritalea myrionectae]
MTQSNIENAAIEFVEVNKSYGDLHVVDNLTLSIEANEFVALLGPSGCGKSTLLKLISGIEAPSAGEIYVDGELVNYKLPRDRNVAMVFQNYALYPHMTVAQNIAYPLKTGFRRQFSAKEIEEKVLRVAEIVDIQSQLAKLPEHLSGGQRQRVALARAIIREPVAFLMDEPLSNLDALLRDGMRQQLMALHKRVGRATLYVTHDQLEAMTMANRIVVLNGGVVQQIGTPREVFHKPANMFVANFVGSPTMNFVRGLVAEDKRSVLLNGGVSLATHPMPTAEIGQPVTIGLRPTDLITARNEDAENVLTGHIFQTEYTGADHLCSLSLTGGEELRVRDDGRAMPNIGDTKRLKVDKDYVHVFDAAGIRIPSKAD